MLSVVCALICKIDSCKQQQIKKLKLQESYRRDFLGNVSHELKTPVFTVQGYLLTLLDGGLEDANIKAIQDAESEKAFEIAYTDIKAAFQYYLSRYNNKQPIIIASHSQGTKHAARLLQEFFDNKP